MKVLIAEDDVTSRSMLQAMICRWGFEAVAVTDGAQAWEQLQKPDGPRLTLLDWMMPDMDGLEVCCGLGRRAARSTVPHHVDRAHRQGGHRTGLDAGANDYISKPITPKS